MEQLFKIILWIHIIAGGTGLTTGTINLIRKKGDRTHKLVGRFFLFGMLTAGFASLILAIMHPNYFLFIIGVFTIYMVSTGYRYLHLKQLAKGQQPAIIDWILMYGMAVFGIAFISFGVYNLIHSSTFGIVFVVFGMVSLNFVKKDFEHYKGKLKHKNYWLLAHLQRMIGAYIASVTAFLVVNMSHLPQVIPGYVYWLLPTAILTPLIFKWSKKFAVNFK